MAANIHSKWPAKGEANTDRDSKLKHAPVKLTNSGLSANGSSNPNICSNGNVIESNLYLLRKKIHCDITFIVGSSRERIQCHRLFLMARSPIFAPMFSDSWNKEREEIEIPDVDSKTFKSFLDFVYADKFFSNESKVSEVLSLLYVAEKYKVQLLVQKCEKLLQQNVKREDCIAVFQAARKYGRTELMKKSGDLIAKSLEVLDNEGRFLEMDKQTLIYVLKRDDLTVKEVELFKMVVKWGKRQIELGAASGLVEALNDLIPLIRFPTMTLNEFTTVVVPTALLPPNDMVQIFSYFGSDKSVQKQMEKSLKFSTAVRGVSGRDDRGSRDGGFFLGLPWAGIPVNPPVPAPVRTPSFSRSLGQNSNRYDRSSNSRVRRQNSTLANPYDSNFDPNFDSDLYGDYY